MEFFQDLLLFSEAMETIDDYNNYGRIPDGVSPESDATVGSLTLDDFFQSFPAPATPPDLFPFYDFDFDLFPWSETFSVPTAESQLSNLSIHEESDFAGNPRSPISNKRKAVQFLGDTVPFSRDFSDSLHDPSAKRSRTVPSCLPLLSNESLEDFDRPSLSEYESSESKDCSSSESSGLSPRQREQPIHRDQLLDVSRGSTDTDSMSLTEHRGMLLIHLLVALAEAISNDSRDLAEVLLPRLKKLVKSTGSNIERMSFYFYHALNSLFTGKNELDVEPHHKVPKEDLLLVYRVLIEIYPCSRLAQFTANQCILEAIPTGSKKLHIVDFDLIDGVQWPPLMEALVSEGFSVEHIRLTSIKWTASSENSSIRTFNRLRDFSEELGLEFSFEEVELEDLGNCLREEEEDEVSIVNCMFRQLHMLERSSWQVSKFLEASKIFSPRVFTLSYCNFSEKEGRGDLMNRLSSCLQRASAVYDSLEWALPTQKLARQLVERLFLGPRFCRELMFEKEEITLRCIAENLGFVPGRMSSQNLGQGRDLIRLHAQEGHFYRLETLNPNEISLGWGETCLVSTSAWHLL